MPDDLIILYLKKLLGLPTVVLEWPTVLHSLIIPLFLFSYAIKLLLENMRFFHSSTVNWAIALAVSFTVLLFIAQTGPFVAAFAIFMIFLFKWHGARAIIAGFICGALYLFVVYPLLATYLV